MATPREPLRSHVIEPARSNRSHCHHCGVRIAKGELRLTEVFGSEGPWARAKQRVRRPDDDDRYRRGDGPPDVWTRSHHLPCAARHEPYKLRSALAVAAIAIPDRDALERAIEAALAVVDRAEEDASTRAEYQQWLERLREDADDELVAVFGDWLQSVGDPRGELVAVQLALETATGDERLRLGGVEQKLLAEHRRRFVPDRLEATLGWRRGFVHRLAVRQFDAASLARVFAHPSCRLLRELVIEEPDWGVPAFAPAANLPRPLPATLQVLELARPTSKPAIGPVGPLLADGVPQLRRLVLAGAAELEDLVHPTLAELELRCDDARGVTRADLRGASATFVERCASTSRTKLPALARLILDVPRGLPAAIAALAATGVLDGLHELVLRGDLASNLALVRSLAFRVELLDVRAVPLTGAELASLAPRADRVIAETPAEPAVAAPLDLEWRVRHTRRPEWGIGRVVEEGDDGLQVEFEHGGRKHVRNVELLEEVPA